jgi:hypothetical protein
VKTVLEDWSWVQKKRLSVPTSAADATLSACAARINAIRIVMRKKPDDI